MSGMIKEIKSIKNMAVFQDFNWDTTVRDAGKNIVPFKKINIIYGRNYSGKTTVSRIIRALEIGSISNKYINNPDFVISFDGLPDATLSNPKSHGQVVRVFNDDFVKDNLKFIKNEDEAIDAFAILGEDNNKIEDEIANHQNELGDFDTGTGMYRSLRDAETEHRATFDCARSADQILEELLKTKANGDIKQKTHIYGEVTYNITKLKDDISSVLQQGFIPLTQEKKDNYLQLIKEEAKVDIPFSSLDLKYDRIYSQAKILLEKKISVSESIQELLNNAVLQKWVKEGRELHKGVRTKCGFCGNPLPEDLWQKLDKHFNKESEQLDADLKTLLNELDAEIVKTDSFLMIEKRLFYSSFSKSLDDLWFNVLKARTDYKTVLLEIGKLIKQRIDDVFTPITFPEMVNYSKCFQELFEQYEILRKQSNEFTIKLKSSQNKAKMQLKLSEVYRFIEEIKYLDQKKKIDEYKIKAKEKEDIKNNIALSIQQKKKNIDELKSKLRDESKGADKVNELLNHYFGHRHLSLQAVQVQPAQGTGVISYRFEVVREGSKAYHLSGGECSLIAFCYFMAKLDDVETKDSRPIIWIDDPISSLDSNHIFFVYSLINTRIVLPIDIVENGQPGKKERYLQLFISTHNLEFLKYLKKISTDFKGKGPNKIKIREFFLIERFGKHSQIKPMPNFLKTFVTEFNYLFNQIYKCAHASELNDANCETFYNFGNNARKFLELYLYYKYPNAIEDSERIIRFFGEDAATEITGRVTNEFSHLDGIFERGAIPTEVPEMQSTAQFILDKIAEKDPDQFQALLQSIGIEPTIPIPTKQKRYQIMQYQKIRPLSQVQRNRYHIKPADLSLKKN